MPRRRILVIDDDPLMVRSIRRILRAHEVDEASTLSEGMAALQGGDPYDLVLCDLRLPDGSGTTLEDRWPEGRRRVVYVTGGACTRDESDFLAHPDRRWLSKPFSIASLRGLVDTVLGEA